jgi:hypothetical protein
MYWNFRPSGVVRLYRNSSVADAQTTSTKLIRTATNRQRIVKRNCPLTTALRFWSLLMIPLQKLKEFLDLFFSGIRAVIKRKEFMRLQIHKIVSCGQTSVCAPQSFERPGHN